MIVGNTSVYINLHERRCFTFLRHLKSNTVNSSDGGKRGLDRKEVQLGLDRFYHIVSSFLFY